MSAEPSLVVQLAIGFVFLMSAGTKTAAPRSFARGVLNYRILPQRGAYVFAWSLIPVEAFLAYSHLSGHLLSVAIDIGLVTLSCMLVAVGTVLWRGEAISCHCFGDTGETVGMRTLIRVGCLLLGEVYLGVNIGAAGRLQTVSVLDLAAIQLAALLLVAAGWLLKTDELRELSRPCLTCRMLAQKRELEFAKE